MRKWQNLVENGGKDVSSPPLVIHGDKDPMLQVKFTDDAVNITADLQVEYIRDPGVEHTGAVTATQRMWMEWIGERFAGKAVEIGLVRREVKVARHLEYYQDKINWFFGSATEFWHTP